MPCFELLCMSVQTLKTTRRKRKVTQPALCDGINTSESNDRCKPPPTKPLNTMTTTSAHDRNKPGDEPGGNNQQRRRRRKRQRQQHQQQQHSNEKENGTTSSMDNTHTTHTTRITIVTGRHIIYFFGAVCVCCGWWTGVWGFHKGAVLCLRGGLCRVWSRCAGLWGLWVGPGRP